MTRGAAHQLYPASPPQPGQDAVPPAHRQWLVKHTLLPEWHGQLIKQVLHARTSEESKVWMLMCTRAVYPSNAGAIDMLLYLD